MALVVGGVPVTVVGVCAVEPMYGVTVYVVDAPPVLGADQLTFAESKPAAAVTLVTLPGAAIGVNTGSTQ